MRVFPLRVFFEESLSFHVEMSTGVVLDETERTAIVTELNRIEGSILLPQSCYIPALFFSWYSSTGEHVLKVSKDRVLVIRVWPREFPIGFFLREGNVDRVAFYVRVKSQCLYLWRARASEQADDGQSNRDCGSADGVEEFSEVGFHGGWG